jgi:hypothetical protein
MEERGNAAPLLFFKAFSGHGGAEKSTPGTIAIWRKRLNLKYITGIGIKLVRVA